MLFLLNDSLVELPVPELHLQQRWRAMGCGDPFKLRAQDAINFVTDQIAAAGQAGQKITVEQAHDFAALIIAKTWANSLILKPTAGGRLEPRLYDLPKLVLETYRRGAANDEVAVRQTLIA